MFKRWKLADIRLIDNEADLGRAAAYYAATHSQVTIGEASAMKRTIQEQARKLNIPMDRLEWLACEFFSEEVRNA